MKAPHRPNKLGQQAKRPLDKNRAWTWRATLLLFAILLTGPACVDGLNGLLISDSDEVQIGQSVDQSIESEYRILADSDPVAQWAQQLVGHLQNSSDSFRQSADFGGFKVEVIHDDELVNAFAGPGGFTYISTGLILAATSCAEPAGVMSHELAHVTQRHSVKSIESQYTVSQVAAWLLGDGIAADGINLISTFLSGTQFSQEHEYEADDVGVQIAYAAGYNPYGFVEFFEKLEAMSGGDPEMPSFFASHPPTGERIERVIERINQMAPGVTRGQTPPSYECIGTTLTLQQVQDQIRSGNLSYKN
ncbi:MAG: M48 family metalloprotease [Myxococcota bacterium]|nr:M48 family metalloprotease [Myxococcota bacterium]